MSDLPSDRYFVTERDVREVQQGEFESLRVSFAHRIEPDGSFSGTMQVNGRARKIEGIRFTDQKAVEQFLTDNRSRLRAV